MLALLLSALCLCLLQAPLAECQYEYEEPLLYDTFPDGFMWGGNSKWGISVLHLSTYLSFSAATSAFQVNAKHGQFG